MRPKLLLRSRNLAKDIIGSPYESIKSTDESGSINRRGNNLDMN